MMQHTSVPQISILGCGWLGLPLAGTFINHGYKVKGSTTRSSKIKELENEGIIPYVIKADEEHIEGDLSGLVSGSEILIIDIPPGLRANPSRNFPAIIKNLLNALTPDGIKHVLFISSTSVFPDTPQVFTEKDKPLPATTAGVQLQKAEELIIDDHRQNTIIRFGGLIGPGRHPVTFLSGKTQLKGGNSPVNLIHLDDCIGIITEVVKQQHWGQIFHGVAPQHPDKLNYYTSAAEILNLPAPVYADNTSDGSGKIISSEHTISQLSYSFLNPTLHP